jgi:hypothetical protein
MQQRTSALQIRLGSTTTAVHCPARRCVIHPNIHRHRMAIRARWAVWALAGAMTGKDRETQALRARLLEFLKFRVLAAQDSFFEADCDADVLRQWLAGVWPQACRLSDADLLLTWERARQLYTEEPRRGGP